MIELSKRLQIVANKVEFASKLADIGSDHAYLPIFLVQNNIISYAVAGEIATGPYNNAVKEVNKNKLGEQISVRHGTGLSVLQDKEQINTITICGMGGALIKEILDEGIEKNNLRGNERLILQPNVGEEILRYFLEKENYEILDEEIIEENGKIYEVIVAEKSKKPIHYTNKELKFGPILSRKKSEVFIKKWSIELEKLEYVISQLYQSKSDQKIKIGRLRNQAKEIKEIIQ